MEQQQPQDQGQGQEAQEVQPEQNGHAGMTAAERESLEAQQQEAERVAAQIQAEGPVIGTAPDGGPLVLDPNLVNYGKALAIGAGIGGLLVLIWWTRTVNQRHQDQAQVDSGDSGK